MDNFPNVLFSEIKSFIKFATMTMSFPAIPKARVYYLISLMPKQSQRMATAARRELDKLSERNFDFNAFMRGLFFSKDIVKRTAYYHIKTMLEKTT